MATDPWSWDDVYGSPKPELPPEEDLSLTPPPFNWTAGAKALGMGLMEGISTPGQIINAAAGKGLHALGSPSEQPFSSQAAEAFSPSSGYGRSVLKPVVGTAFQMMLDPVSYGALGVLNKLGGVGTKLHALISAGFTGSMGYGGYEAAKAAAKEVEARGYTPEAVEEITQSLVDFLFAGAGAKGLAGDFNKMRPSVQQAARDAEQKRMSEMPQFGPTRETMLDLSQQEAQALDPYQVRGAGGLRQVSSLEEAAALSARPAAPDITKLTPEADATLEAMFNESLAEANQLVAQRAHPSLRPMGPEAPPLPQQVVFLESPKHAAAFGLNEYRNAGFDAATGTLYITPRGRALVLQAPDAAGIQRRINQLISHEVQHPAQAMGRATGSVDPRTGQPLEGPTTEHALGGEEALFDDRTADLSMIQGEFELSRRLNESAKLRELNARVEASGRLRQLYGPEGLETAISGTYSPETLKLAADLGMIPETPLAFEAAEAATPEPVMLEAREPSRLAPAGGRSKLSQVFQDPRDPRVKAAIENDKLRTLADEAEGAAGTIRGALGEAKPPAPQLDPVARALAERAAQRAAAGLPQETSAIKPPPTPLQGLLATPRRALGALLGRRVPAVATPVAAPAPEAPAAPESVLARALALQKRKEAGLETRGTTKGTPTYQGPGAMKEIADMANAMRSGTFGAKNQAAMELLGRPRGWLRPFYQGAHNMIHANKGVVTPEVARYLNDIRYIARVAKRSLYGDRGISPDATKRASAQRSEARSAERAKLAKAEKIETPEALRARDRELRQAKRVEAELLNKDHFETLRQAASRLNEILAKGGKGTAELSKMETALQRIRENGTEILYGDQVRLFRDYVAKVEELRAKAQAAAPAPAQAEGPKPAPEAIKPPPAPARAAAPTAEAAPATAARIGLRTFRKGGKLAPAGGKSNLERMRRPEQKFTKEELEKLKREARPQAERQGPPAPTRVGPRALAGLLRRLSYSAEVPKVEFKSPEPEAKPKRLPSVAAIKRWAGIRKEAPPAAMAQTSEAFAAGRPGGKQYETAKARATKLQAEGIEVRRREALAAAEKAMPEKYTKGDWAKFSDKRKRAAIKAFTKRLNAALGRPPKETPSPEALEMMEKALASDSKEIPEWMRYELRNKEYGSFAQLFDWAGQLKEVEWKQPVKGPAGDEARAANAALPKFIRIAGRKIELPENSPLRRLKEDLASEDWVRDAQGRAAADRTALDKLLGAPEQVVHGEKIPGREGLVEREGKLSAQLIEKAGFSPATAKRLQAAFNEVYKRFSGGKLEGTQHPSYRALEAFAAEAKKIVDEAQLLPVAPLRRVTGSLAKNLSLREKGKAPESDWRRIAALSSRISRDTKVATLRRHAVRLGGTSIPHPSRKAEYENSRTWPTSKAYQRRGGKPTVVEKLYGKEKTLDAVENALGIKFTDRESVWKAHNQGSVGTGGKRQLFSHLEFTISYIDGLKARLGQLTDLKRWAEGKQGVPDHAKKLAEQHERWLKTGKGPKGRSLETSLAMGKSINLENVRQVLRNARRIDPRNQIDWRPGDPEWKGPVGGEQKVFTRNRLGTTQTQVQWVGNTRQLRLLDTYEYPELMGSGGKVGRGTVPDLLDLDSKLRAFPTGGRAGMKVKPMDEETLQGLLAETHGSKSIMRSAETGKGVESKLEEAGLGEERESSTAKGVVEEGVTETGDLASGELGSSWEQDLLRLKKATRTSTTGMGGGAREKGVVGDLERREIAFPRAHEPKAEKAAAPEAPAKPESEAAAWARRNRQMLADNLRRLKKAGKYKPAVVRNPKTGQLEVKPENLRISHSKYLELLPDLMRAQGLEPKGVKLKGELATLRKPSFLAPAGGKTARPAGWGQLPKAVQEVAELPKNQRIKESVGEAKAASAFRSFSHWYNVTRPLKTAIDISIPFRQTWELASGQLVRDVGAFLHLRGKDDTSFARNLASSIKAFGSKDYYERAKAAMENEPWYKAGEELGLNYTSAEHPNEAYRGKEAWDKVVGAAAKYLPPIKALKWGVEGSQRAAAIFQNKTMRDGLKHYIEAVEAYKQSKKLSPELTESEIKDAVTTINNAASRGLVFKSKDVNEALGTFLYSAQMNASRLRTLGNLLSGHKFYSSPATAHAARMQLLRGITGAAAMTGAVYAIGKLAGQEPEIEADPRSTDWGKVRFGNTTFDGWGGNQQFLRVAAQLQSGKQKERSTGLLKDRKVGDTLATFLRSKLGPGASMTWSLLDKRTLSGESLDFSKGSPDPVGAAVTLTKEALFPMSVDDTISLWKENPRLAWLLPLMLMGEGMAAGGGGKEAWLEDRSASEILTGAPSKLREMDKANAKELRARMVTPPRLGTKVTLPGRDAWGRRNYYNLSLSERQEFEKEYMPVVTELLYEMINSATYRNLPDDAKKKRIYRYVHQLNQRYSASKKAKKLLRTKYKSKELKPANRAPREESWFEQFGIGGPEED